MPPIGAPASGPSIRRKIKIPDIVRQNIPVDIDEHKGFMPSCSCVSPESAHMFDDRVIVETVVDKGMRALRFQFKSEVGGPFGKSGPDWKQFAPYAVYVNEAGEIFLRATLPTGTGATQDQEYGTQYRTDALPRMATMLFSALACVGVWYGQFELIDIAQSLGEHPELFYTSGGELPFTHRVAEQVRANGQ